MAEKKATEKVKSLPNSEELEKKILGIIMEDPSVVADIFTLLTEEDFYIARNKLLYETLKDRFTNNLPCDVVSLASSMKEDTKNKVGGFTYLNEVQSSYLSSASYLQDVATLKQLHRLRSLILISNGILEKAYNNENSLDVMTYALAQINNVSNETLEKDLEKASISSTEVIDNLIDVYNSGETVESLSTGFFNLDEIANGGFLPGQMNVLAARPGCGKTSFAMNIVANIAVAHPEKVIAVFNLEMAKEELLKRMIATYSGVDSKKISKAELTSDEVSKIVAVKPIFAKSNIYLDDSSDMSAEDIYFKARRLKSKEGRLDLIVIDHMQLIAQNKTIKGTLGRYELMTGISRMVKIMAKELEVPVIVLSQMSRNVEKTDDKDSTMQKRPKMSDLRESGAIEQDADMIFFLTPGEFTLPTEDENIVPLDVVVAKNRSGELSESGLHFAWHKSEMRFEALKNVIMKINKTENNKPKDKAPEVKQEYIPPMSDPFDDSFIPPEDDLSPIESDFMADLQSGAAANMNFKNFDE